jgi:RHS repeat-associated protein
VSEELVYLASEWKIVGTVRSQAVGGSDGVFYPVLTDQIGSPRVVLDPTDGSSRWEWEAKEAFGYQTPNATPGTGAAFNFDARFPGQWFDPETGLYQNGYRDYDPRTGRYVQSDPIGLGGGWNTYAYVGGQVTGSVDVMGLDYIMVAFWHRHQLTDVGHVYLGSLDHSQDYTSPWPNNGMDGPWQNLSYSDTIAHEGRLPDAVFAVDVPDMKSFKREVARHMAMKDWSKISFYRKKSTSCTEAASDALKAGGAMNRWPSFVPLGAGAAGAFSPWVFPSQMESVMSVRAFLGAGVIRIK